MSNTLGFWNIVGNTGVVCIHTALLPNNRLICAARPHEAPYPQNPNVFQSTATEITLKNSQGEWAVSYVSKPLQTNPFCAGHAQYSDGSILVAGGDMRQMPDGNVQPKYLRDGRKSARRYFPCTGNNCVTGQWRDDPDMLVERWYPTIATLADGTAIIISGSTDSLDFSKDTELIKNPTYEYYPPKRTGGWPRNLEILNWAHPMNLYPMVYQLPSGGVFLFVANKTVVIDPRDESISTPFPDLYSPGHLPWIYPYTPTMVMLPLLQKNDFEAELMVCGGSRLNGNTPVSSNECWKLNTDSAAPQWNREQDMPAARVMVDSAILPDGTILFVNGAGWGLAGGSGGQADNAGDPVFETSLYNPEAPAGRRWTNLARSQVARLYHSGIILLESGELVTVGSEMANYVDSNRPTCFPWGTQVCTDPYEYRIERFTPPYLLTGKPRPVIDAAPARLTYTSVFKINLGTTLKIDRVSFIRYSSTTHSTNTDQRLVELEILGQDTDTLYLKAPRDGALAPPGNWMLFALSEGVPSVAKTILMANGPATYVIVPDTVTKTGTVTSPSPTATPNLMKNWGLSLDPSSSILLRSLMSFFAVLFVGFVV